MKKRIISLIALVVLGLMTAFAQVPTTPLTYQTVVRNAQNQLVINQENVTVTVSVWNGAGTSELYRETHSGLSTNANGLLTLMMGTGTVNLGTWDDIDWSDASIKTTVSYNPGDGTVTINSAPAPVTAVPYAIQAGNAIPQVQSNWTEADNTQASFIQNKPNLATVATSGDYNDLTNKPTIPDAQVNADWNATSGVSQILNKPDLSVYATNEALNTFQTQTNNTLTGINSNITNLQSQITSNDQDITALQQNDVTINNRITTDSAALHNALIDTAAAIRGDIHNATLTIQTNGTTTGTFTANQATNATINIDVPAAQVQSNWTEGDNTQASFIQNKPTLATVATSGSYNDLSDQPAINNATLTIKQGETTLGTFTANASEAATITVPTPAAQVQSNWAESDNTSAAYIQNKPTIPTTVAELTDAGDYATVTKVQQDSTTLHSALTDTAAAIRGNFPVVNNATLTIQTNGTTTGTFTANQVSDATINIDVPAAQVQSNWTEADNTQASFIQNKPTIPTTVAELTDAGDYATLGGNNVFTSANDFTAGSVTVPNAISDLRTALANACTQDAVNVCDLLAVFDSLNTRLAYIEAVIGSIVDNLTVPTVTTSQVSNLSASEATVGGVLVSAGSSTITERGVCYSTSNNNPTTSDTKQIVTGTNIGVFSHTLTELHENTTYYFKAYVTTSDNDTYYGEVVSFTTSTPTLAVISDPTTPLVGCDHADVTYTATMTNDQISNYELKWYVNDVEQSGETNTTFAVQYDASITGLEVKCVATRTGGSAEGAITMDITVIPAPSMTLTRLEGNAGDDWGKVEISDVIAVASASWTLNGTEVGTWTSEKTAVLPAGNYIVNITSNNGCPASEETVTIRTSPVCVPQTAINSTLETTYELAGQQYVKTIKDHENNEYNVVQIGSTCWTRENMRAVTSPTTGSYLLDGASSVYQSKSATWPNLDSATFAPKNYGVLYNWCAAADVYHSSYPEIAEASESAVQVVLPHPSTNHRGICPEGWHLPVNQDFINFNTMFPKGGQWATGTDWQSGTATGPGDMSYEERNISGFSALPAGTRTSATNYLYQTAWFWTATEYSATQNWRHVLVYIYNGQAAITGSWNTSWTGIGQFNHQRLSIRCIRNNE